MLQLSQRMWNILCKVVCKKESFFNLPSKTEQSHKNAWKEKIVWFGWIQNTCLQLVLKADLMGKPKKPQRTQKKNNFLSPTDFIATKEKKDWKREFFEWPFLFSGGKATSIFTGDKAQDGTNGERQKNH